MRAVLLLGILSLVVLVNGSCSNYPGLPKSLVARSEVSATMYGQLMATIIYDIYNDYECARRDINQTTIALGGTITFTEELYRLDLGLYFYYDTSSCTQHAITNLTDWRPSGTCTYDGTSTFDGYTCDQFTFTESTTNYMVQYYLEGTNHLIGLTGSRLYSGMTITLNGVTTSWVEGEAISNRNTIFAVPTVCGTGYANPPAVDSDWSGYENEVVSSSSSAGGDDSTPATIDCEDCEDGAYDNCDNGICVCTLEENQSCYEPEDNEAVSVTCSAVLVMLLALLAL